MIKAEWTNADALNLQPTCNQLATDCISRQAAIDVMDSETVSTNPEHFKSSEKFIKFMDDADITSFGQWQWANGFNTALVATKVQLEKLPSAQPEIVRCAECKWFQCNMRFDGHLPKGVDEFECRHWCGSCDPTDFCSYAERKWEENEDE